MFAYFNIAVEHEHLGLSDLAIQFYEVAFKEAKKLGNWSIKNRIITALKKLKNQKRLSFDQLVELLHKLRGLFELFVVMQELLAAGREH